MSFNPRQISRLWHTVRYLRPRQVGARVRLRAAARARRAWPAPARRALEQRRLDAGLQEAVNALGVRGQAAATRARLEPSARAAVDGRCGDASEGIFTFLNQRVALGLPVDWTGQGQTRLWRFHLHYFDYAVDLAVGQAHDVGRLAELMVDWIDRNPLGGPTTGDAWHPYVVSLRIVNWTLALSAAEIRPCAPASFTSLSPGHEGEGRGEGASDGGRSEPAGSAGEAVRARLLESLAEQALFLERNLETDVGGNHLLKNLKALVFAGCFFEGATAEAWRCGFAERFTSELARQVLDDGGHYERSPMYHAQVLGDALEAVAVLRASGAPVPPQLVTLARRMDAFLPLVTHPDGEIALFNDSAFGMTPTPETLHRFARVVLDGDEVTSLPPRFALLACGRSGSHSLGRAGSPAFFSPGSRSLSPGSGGEGQVEGVDGRDEGPQARGPDEVHAAAASGYFVFTSAGRRHFLIADAGAVCPDELPAHAHADLLSYELSLAGVRVIVDSGVSEYEAGPWRDYHRSTRAHNTVVVDGAEQSDCWGAFRVARRARPRDVRIDQAGGFPALAAAHTGYLRLPGHVTHRRRIVQVDAGAWLIVDELLGTGEHRWQSLVHLHPDVTLAPFRAETIEGTRGPARFVVGWFGDLSARLVQGEIGPIQGWYAPEFGRRLPAPTLVLAGGGRLPARFGYLVAVVPAGAAEAHASVQVNGERIRVTIPGGQGPYDL